MEYVFDTMSDTDMEHYFARMTDAELERASADRPDFSHVLEDGPVFILDVPSLVRRHGPFPTGRNGSYHIDVYEDRHQRHFAVYDATVQAASDWDLPYADGEVPF